MDFSQFNKSKIMKTDCHQSNFKGILSNAFELTEGRKEIEGMRFSINVTDNSAVNLQCK